MDSSEVQWWDVLGGSMSQTVLLLICKVKYICITNPFNSTARLDTHKNESVRLLKSRMVFRSVFWIFESFQLYSRNTTWKTRSGVLSIRIELFVAVQCIDWWMHDGWTSSFAVRESTIDVGFSHNVRRRRISR